ncbi:MAG: UDP-2,3-diacylglucosamine diphosphatase [Candidatus Marinimicrobia bacterium]|nr:UDP-2,3-diacylglucosamine diphosphatase [Candidatus Neomarinimicrobiota bacterium]
MNLPIYFISDTHLRLTQSGKEEEKRRNLISFIEHVIDKKGTLFIVGDFFDYWFEYKYVIPKAYFDVLTTLHRANERGIEINYVLGNHDYWVGDFIKNKIFTEVYSNNLNLEINGKIFHITHGDGITSWHRGYRIMKKIIRSRVLIFLYRWIHPDLGYSFARWVSRTGRHPIHTEEYNASVLKELQSYAEEQWKNSADHVIFGHYHQAKHVINNKGTFMVLGDWIIHRTFGLFDGNEFSLNYWRE